MFVAIVAAIFLAIRLGQVKRLAALIAEVSLQSTL